MTPAVILYETVIVSAGVAAIWSWIIFPILAMVDCLRRATLTPPKKVGWFVAVLLTWPIGASIYGFVASDRPLFRWSVLLALYAAAMALWIPRGGLYPG